MTEKQIERKLKKISVLKSILRKERAKFGCYDDSYGRRYTIAEMYFEISDFRKTNLYLNWFTKNFADDVTYPYFQLNAANTYFQVKKMNGAYGSIVKLNCLNIYLVDLLCGNHVEDYDASEWTESESLIWAKKNFEIYRQNLTDGFLDWMDKLSHSSDYHKMKNKYISILKSIKYSENTNQRSELIDAKYECEKQWQEVKSNTTHNMRH